MHRIGALRVGGTARRRARGLVRYLQQRLAPHGRRDAQLRPPGARGRDRPGSGAPARGGGVSVNGGLAGRGERGAVLVVDDDPGVRSLLVAILEDAGESVLSAADGLAALEAVRDHDVALVLLDHLLPGMTGPEVLATLRRDPETMTLPVIIVSGRDGEDDRIDGLGLGANDYIVKPFSPRELVARVRA